MAERRLSILCVLQLFTSAAAVSWGDDNRPALPAASAGPGRSIRVTVVTEEGRPLAGANVHVSVWTDEKFDRNRDFPTDASGQVVATLPNSLQIMRLWASQEGYVPLFANWDIERHTDFEDYPREFQFVMPKGTVIGGVIRDESGKPIEGALVEVALHQLTPEIPSGVQRPVVSTWLAEGEDAIKTDAEGRWSLSNMPAGDEHRVLLKLTHPDFISTGWGGAPAEGFPSLNDLRERTAASVMKSGVALTGVIVDPEGLLVPGAVVVWSDDPYNEAGSQEIRTDAGGCFRIPPQPAGARWLTVVAAGWSPLRLLVGFQPDQPPLKLELERGHMLQVVFVDEQGRPVPEVWVGIDSWQKSQSLYNHRHPNVLDTRIPVKANGEGLYEWNWAPEDEVAYNFSKQGYRYVEGQRLTADGTRHVITLQRETDEE